MKVRRYPRIQREIPGSIFFSVRGFFYSGPFRFNWVNRGRNEENEIGFRVTCSRTLVLLVGTSGWTCGKCHNALEDVVVTASRTETPLSQVASSVTVIDEEEITARQKSTVLELLRSVPGVDVVQSGGFGGATSIYLRGTATRHTLVLIDGVEYSDPTSITRSADIANLTTDNIERIEIVRGAQSVLYGSDAIGGVINIITKKGHGKVKAYASVEGGSYHTWREKAGISGGGDRTNISLAVSRSDSDGFSSANEDNGNAEDDGYKNTTVSFNAGVTPSDILDLNLNLHFTDAEYDYDGVVYDSSFNRNTFQVTRTMFRIQKNLPGVFRVYCTCWMIAGSCSWVQPLRI